ncbi:MAG: 1-acyl-sn-glycerol-3-phosphate acyltransferase, partial [Bacteroidota bacterium]|nr:1-acyl-sn-glycerol-3-phosphate acyltransferase [Bacteroidota bacterium]
LVVAPHTSNWDYVIGKLIFYAYGISSHVLMKKELFFFPLGFFLKALGGIPLDRSRNENTVNKMIDLFKTKDEFILTITPEGSRKKSDNWKTGFYYIAKYANVPVYLGYCNYEKKVVGINGPFFFHQKLEDSLNILNDFYKDKVPKFPENFSLHKMQV